MALQVWEDPRSRRNLPRFLMLHPFRALLVRLHASSVLGRKTAVVDTARVWNRWSTILLPAWHSRPDPTVSGHASMDTLKSVTHGVNPRL